MAMRWLWFSGHYRVGINNLLASSLQNNIIGTDNHLQALLQDIDIHVAGCECAVNSTTQFDEISLEEV